MFFYHLAEKCQPMFISIHDRVITLYFLIVQLDHFYQVGFCLLWLCGNQWYLHAHIHLLYKLNKRHVPLPTCTPSRAVCQLGWWLWYVSVWACVSFLLDKRSHRWLPATGCTVNTMWQQHDKTSPALQANSHLLHPPSSSWTQWK